MTLSTTPPRPAWHAEIQRIKSDLARLDEDIDRLFHLFRRIAEEHNGLDDQVDEIWKRTMTALESEPSGRHAERNA